MKELYRFRQFLAEGVIKENTEEEIKSILSKSYPGAYSEDDFEEIINLYNTKYKDYKDSYGKLDGVEQAAFKFNYANNRDIMTGMKAGSKSSTSITFPEMEDEFEGAMSSMSVSKEEYLQDIINASADEIVSDDYYEIMNAVEQGVYSKDEAVKLAKSWAKEKLSTLAEGKLLKEDQSPKFKIGDFVQPKSRDKYIGQIEDVYINKPENLEMKDDEYVYSVEKLNYRGRNAMSFDFKESDLESISDPTEYIKSLTPYKRRN
jgi:hypothetical protein